MDWQLRLIQMLMKLPIHLVCKLHPKYIRENTIHPLRKYIDLFVEPFENLLDEIDVIVIDYFKSTTIATAMCTDKTVVMIDIDGLELKPKAREMLQQRCRWLTAQFDSSNRPIVEEAALKDAICGSLEPADPTLFRQLYAGETVGN